MKKKFLIILFICIIGGIIFGGDYLWNKKNNSEINIKYELTESSINKLNSIFEMQFKMKPIEIVNSRDGNNMLNLFVIDIINQLNIVIPNLTNETYQKKYNLEFFNANQGLNGDAYAYSNNYKLSPYMKEPTLKKESLEFEKINKSINEILNPYTIDGISKLSIAKKNQIKNALIVERDKLLILYSKMNKGNLKKAQLWKDKNLKIHNEMDKIYPM